MSEMFTCGDHGALVSYLYDECTPNERRTIGTHLAICRSCAEEVAALGATREQLAEWTVPDTELGFRVVSDTPPNVLRPSRWWQKPMPAWAQAAAAAAIFAVGMTLGAVRGAAPASAPAVATTRAAATVTPADLAAVEQRLRSEMSQLRSTSNTAATAPADARVLERVRTMIDESEQRQRRELALRAAEMARDFDGQRRDDLTRIERTLGQMDGTTGYEVAQQRQVLNYLMRVSQRGQ